MAKRRPPPKIFMDKDGKALPDNVDISKLWYEAKGEPWKRRESFDNISGTTIPFEKEYYDLPKDLRLKDIERKKKNLAKLEKEIAYLEYLEKESLNKNLAQKLEDKNLDEEHLKRLIAIAEHDEYPPKLKEPKE